MNLDEMANNESLGFLVWQDVTLPMMIEKMYWTTGRTGAEALAAFWKDVADGKMPAIMRELGAPEDIGVCHAVNTLAKHFFYVDKIFQVKE